MPSSRISALCRAALVSGLVSAGLVPLAHAARYHRLTDSPKGPTGSTRTIPWRGLP